MSIRISTYHIPEDDRVSMQILFDIDLCHIIFDADMDYFYNILKFSSITIFNNFTKLKQRRRKKEKKKHIAFVITNCYKRHP